MVVANQIYSFHSEHLVIIIAFQIKGLSFVYKTYFDIFFSSDAFHCFSSLTFIKTYIQQN